MITEPVPVSPHDTPKPPDRTNPRELLGQSVALAQVEVTAISDTAPVTPADPVMVALPHEIDLTNADSVGEQLAAACAPGAAMVIADMTATTFCDSTGIRMLVLACQQATDHGTELRLLVTRPGVWRAMQAMGADVVLPVYQSVREALADSGVRGPQARPQRTG